MKAGKQQSIDTNQQIPRRYREVEQALAKEKNTNIQLHVQLTNAMKELQQVRQECESSLSLRTFCRNDIRVIHMICFFLQAQFFSDCH